MLDTDIELSINVSFLFLNIKEEMIRNNGYSATNYEVRTEDGYILTMFRVTKGDEIFREGKQKQPVFLLHGMASAQAFFTKTGNNSLGAERKLANLSWMRASKHHSHIKCCWSFILSYI